MNEELVAGAILLIAASIGAAIGAAIMVPSDNNTKLINQQSSEYNKCIAELPRNKDCTLTGFVYTVTTKKENN